MAAWVWQATSVRAAGQVKTTGTGFDTVNVEAQVVVNGGHELVYVQVTVLEPPHAEGAPVLLLVSEGLHPPLAITEASQIVYLPSMAACVWQAASF